MHGAADCVFLVRAWRGASPPRASLHVVQRRAFPSPDLLEILLLALVAMFFPALLAVVLIAIRSRHPQKLLASFLAGGLLSAISVGLTIVFSLQGASVDSSSSSGGDPALYLVVGVLSLIAAYVVDRKKLLGKPKPAKVETDTDKKPDRLERALDKGAPYAFVAGIILCAFPGLSALVALKDIAQLGYSTSATVLVTIGFFLIMFAFIEVPLLGFAVVPDRATATTLQFNRWLDAHMNRLAVYVLGGLGVFLIARGILLLF
jgi:Sap, sulfolipid-1-addressing protein